MIDWFSVPTPRTTSHHELRSTVGSLLSQLGSLQPNARKSATPETQYQQPVRSSPQQPVHYPGASARASQPRSSWTVPQHLPTPVVSQRSSRSIAPHSGSQQAPVQSSQYATSTASKAPYATASSTASKGSYAVTSSTASKAPNAATHGQQQTKQSTSTESKMGLVKVYIIGFANVPGSFHA